MAHVEFTFQNLQLAGEVVDMPIDISCWRATLLFMSKKTDKLTIDGVPFNFLYDLDNNLKGVGRIELGGLVVDGKPVNIKHDLRISISAGQPFQLLLVRQYYVDNGTDDKG